VLATSFVLLLPAALVAWIVPVGHPALLLGSIPLAMALSVASSSLGAAVWKRRPRSRDLVFADLMVWGWLRRFRAERRLAEAREVLGADAKGLSPDRRVEAMTLLSGMLEARDAYTHGHSRRVTRHAERIARAMHLPEAEVAQVRTAAALHDVGKIHTPRQVLNKPGRLTEEEFALIKRHPGDGADMLVRIGDPEITAMVRHHHERLDGGGYPSGLAGGDIPLGARIIAVADTFDAMTSTRSYRRACSHKKALDVLYKEAGTQLDADAVAAFVGYYSGSRSVAWSALAAALPQRLFTWMGSATQGLGSGAAAVAQTLPAIGAAALLAGSGGPGIPHSPLPALERQVAAQTDAAAIAAVAPTDLADRGSQRSARRVAGERPSRQAPRTRTRSRTRTPSASRPGSRGSAPSSGATPQPEHKPRSPGGGGHSPLPDPTPVPAVEAPSVDVPQPQLPHVELPDVELPDVELPVDLPVDLPPIQLPDVELPDLELPTLP
jgi:putative nucleotidyltransferase with HDIG domain